jgi:ferredoxin
MTRHRKPADLRLAVDPVACEAIGLCAYLAGDLIELDRWGYPRVPNGKLGRKEVSAARRATRACPRRALHLLADADAR